MPAILAPFAVCAAQQPVDPAAFVAGVVRVGDRDYPYQLLEPLPAQRGGPLPLVVFLHGSGERGDDNARHLRYLPAQCATPAMRATMPCFLLAVQCPAEGRWTGAALDAVVVAMDAVLARPGVDHARVYLTGLSMGGFGAFELAARWPDRFAALLAICGGGDDRIAPRLVGLPTQVWHGTADRSVPVERSRQLVAALRAAGAVVDFHELAGVGHDSWNQAYGQGDGLRWLFAQDQRQQRRGAYALPATVPSLAGELAGGRFVLARGARCIAAADAQPAARLWLEHWRGSAVLRPGLVADADAGAGDCTFRVEAQLPVAFRIEVSDRLLVRARDALQLARAAAAMDMLLATWPEAACPTGTFDCRLPPVPLVVEFGPAPTPWAANDVLAAVHEAWRFGAGALCFAGAASLPGFDPATWRQLVDEATRHGVRFVSADEWDPAACVVPGATLPQRLSAPTPAVAPPAYRLQLDSAPPAAALAAMRWQLPMLAEWANATGPVHVAGLLARLGALRR